MSISIAQMTRLLSLFKQSHPAFIEGFRQALITAQAPKAHNTLEGTVTDSQTAQPLEGVVIIAESNRKTALTSASGRYHLAGLKVGLQKFTIAVNGYAPQTITAYIIRGKTSTFNISLQAIAFHIATEAAAEVA